MADRPVHWHEGMFMGPQHLQAAQRYDATQRRRASRAAVYYNWGLHKLDLNEKALANHQLEILALTASLRDGTLVELPEDGPLPVIDLRPHLERSPQVTVHLALPRFRTGQANVSEKAQSEADRFLLEMRDIEDENTGMDPQPVKFRLLNVKLLLSDGGEHAGYDTLPIFKIKKSSDAETTPRLDDLYIPPLLGGDCWRTLQIDILGAIHHRVGVKIDLLSGQALTRKMALASQAAEDIRVVGQLRVLNEAYTVLNILAFAKGVHPLESYTELCRLVGQLSIFNPSKFRPPELPRYDHDDLGRIFYAVKREIDELLNLIVEPDWIARPFHGVSKRMEVTLEPAWVAAADWQMFVAVQSTLPAAQCVALFGEHGSLDMKIGSAQRVDQHFERAVTGLKFTHTQSPPALPKREGLTYFQVDRKSQPNEWEYVKNSLTVAARINDRAVVGNIDGQESITIRHQNQNVPVDITLYVTKQTTG